MTAANPTIEVAASGRRGGKRPPRVSGGVPLLGQLLELRRAPLELFWRVRRECGEVGEMRWAGQRVVMFSGEEAHEAFFRAPDEQLDQASAYPFMTPVFGRGVVFDASPEQRKQAMKNSSLRDKMMRGHAERIAAETERMIAGWGESGEIDLLDFFGELTLYTSSACLMGPEFREELTPEYWTLFQDLELGTDAIAYVNPYLPIPSFRKRDKARRRLVVLIQDIIDRRKRAGQKTGDLVSILTTLRDENGTPRYTTDQITGMFISMMFAGHHTTSGTSAWTLLELLLNPDVLQRVVEELDSLYADGREVSYQALREIPELECSLKETLRLHPPLIILMRKVMEELEYKDFVIEEGVTVAVSPAISNRMPEHFPEPERFDPERYKPGREEDKQSFAWLPFGAGRHRCVGAAFAMVQLKAIFSVLLRSFEFELAQPKASYRNDHSKMVVTLKQPCRVRYRRRAKRSESESAADPATPPATRSAGARVSVDADLCQGHGVCAAECPEIFTIDDQAMKVRLLREDVPAELREKADAAVRYCPTHALRIEEDRGD
jgi:sterol 14-demethylase